MSPSIIISPYSAFTLLFSFFGLLFILSSACQSLPSIVRFHQGLAKSVLVDDANGDDMVDYVYNPSESSDCCIILSKSNHPNLVYEDGKKLIMKFAGIGLCLKVPLLAPNAFTIKQEWIS